MINNDRIVPIQKIDYLSMIGTIINIVKQGAIDVLEPTTVDGTFNVTENMTVLANQPVKTLDFASDVTNATVYFVAAYDFTGFTIDGESVPANNYSIKPDGATLYVAHNDRADISVITITPEIVDNGE